MTPRCSIPDCPYRVRVALKTVRPYEGGGWASWPEVPISDRCLRHDEQRPESKPVSVEDFDPAKHL